MAFDIDGWVSAMHGAGNKMVWHYWTNDVITLVDDSGYFNAVGAQLHKGDTILVSADVDGSPLAGQLIVTSADFAATVTTTLFADGVTLTLSQPITMIVSVPAIGTAETIYASPAIPDGFEGTVTRVLGLSHGNGPGSGGTSTITITVPTTGAIATLPFVEGYTAGTLIEDTSITGHVALADTGGVITIATDGTGAHTEAATVTLEVTLAPE